jgi:protein-S-isoprenylcysteine O-methyltransferase Ste14
MLEQVLDYLDRHWALLPQPWWLVVGLYEALLLLAWSLEQVLLRRIRRATGDPIDGAGSDRGFQKRFLLYFLLLQLPLLRLGRWESPFPYSWTTVWTGVSVSVLGAALRLHAIRVLAQYFSYVVKVGASHRLVTEGPYEHVRHPAYTGLILFFLGLALVLCSLWLGLMIWAVLAVIVTVRVRREERWLSERFGAQYEAWHARTTRFIPFVV